MIGYFAFNQQRQTTVRQTTEENEKSAQTDANTARTMALARFGHRPPARALHTNRQD